VNHPALVKTSDQPSFCSSNVLPFTSAEALHSSDISPVPSLNKTPWGNSKENEFTLQQIF
jgi:hypothetical protein